MSTTIHTITGPRAPAHEILNIPAQEVVTSPNWRKRCQPRRLPPLNQCLQEAPKELVQDKVDVPADAHSRKRYRSTHIIRKLPKGCVAPYERRRPAGYFAPDHNSMSTKGLVDNLEDIAVDCKVSQVATRMEWAEATYDLNKLAFYQQNVEMFPDYPYMFNQYVVPESPPEGYAKYPPIYTQKRIQTSWPKEAAHPSLASEYYGFQNGREEPTLATYIARNVTFPTQPLYLTHPPAADLSLFH